MILAVGAHPDDVEFGCFGTLARLGRDEEVRILVFSSGQIAGDPDTRQEEAKSSGKLINAKVRILKFHDGKITQSPHSVNVLKEEIKRSGVTKMFAPFYNDTHQDHVAVSKIAMSCWKDVGGLLFYEVPSTTGFDPNFFCDISSTFVVKSRALSLFKSQTPKPYMDIGQIRGLAKYRAWQTNHSNALFEAFVLFRWVANSGSKTNRRSAEDRLINKEKSIFPV